MHELYLRTHKSNTKSHIFYIFEQFLLFGQEYKIIRIININ